MTLPDDLDVAARAYLNDPDGYTAARLRAALDTRLSRADTAPFVLRVGEALIAALPGAFQLADGLGWDSDDFTDRDTLEAVADRLLGALAAPSRDAGLDEPRAHLEAAYEELQERYLALADPERISVRRVGLIALLREVDTGGFWSGELGITYPADQSEAES